METAGRNGVALFQVLGDGFCFGAAAVTTRTIACYVVAASEFLDGSPAYHRGPCNRLATRGADQAAPYLSTSIRRNPSRTAIFRLLWLFHGGGRRTRYDYRYSQ